MKRGMGMSNKESVEMKSLPYNFVPFANEWVYVYSKDTLPKHTDAGGISGMLEYEMQQCSDMILELREAFGKKKFISGSSVRGRIRSNIEIISASYPRFVGEGRLLKDEKEGGAGFIDYAMAIFGFTSEDTNEKSKTSYKSRVRFSAVDIDGDLDIKEQCDFLLPSPNTKSCAMYLEQNDEGGLKGYEDKGARMRGHKYYHILEEALICGNVRANMKATRDIIKNTGIKLRGRVYFDNLREDELGLLLLGIDVSLGKSSKKSKGKFGKIIRNELYDSIGGAKPYGYGKVKMSVLKLNVESKSKSLESIMKGHECNKKDFSAYIDKFIDKMESISGKKYFELVDMEMYIQSKSEVENDGVDVRWDKLKNGYPKNWRLKDGREFIDFGDSNPALDIESMAERLGSRYKVQTKGRR